MSALCGPACGYCGMCTAEWEREADDIEDPEDDGIVCEFCSWCNQPMAEDVSTYPYCSSLCAACAATDDEMESRPL